MSDSSDDDVVTINRSQNKRKRIRLASENSEGNPEEQSSSNQDEEHQSSILESEDELISVALSSKAEANGNSSKKTTVIQIDEEEEDIDDDDDDDLDDGDREDDELIAGLYEDEDHPAERQSSAAQKKIRSIRDNVVDFFQTASAIDLESIPGVSKKKVEQILALRPFKTWDDLNYKFSNHKSAGINEDVVINAVKTIKSRNIVEKLMNDCQKLARDIGQLVDRLPEAPQPKCIPSHLKLAPYQLIGLNWLALLHNKGVNGILADEMGLGKTIQVIAFLAYLRERLNMPGHHLIIVPASTLDNWEREFDIWCPEIRILQYYGSQDERAQIRYWVARNADQVDVVLTTYNVAQAPEDRKLFKRLHFEYLVFDEAHMLKNMKSSRYQSLIKIKSKRRILLTGTPLQNNLVELMSLLVFTMPRMLMSKMSHVEVLFSAASREEGGKTQFEKERIEQAKKIMKPFVLRRLKENVLKHLPKKSEEIVKVSLAPSQERLYKKLVDSFKREIRGHEREVLDNDQSFSDESCDDIKKGAGMLMAMRKMANHPLLMLNLYTKDKLRKMAALMLNEPTHINSDKQLIYEDMCVMHDFELHKLCTTYKSIESFKLSDEDIVNSGKFKFLDKLLEDLKASKQRCLLFSQFTMMLDIFEEYLTIRDYEFLRLDGTTKVSERIELIDEFNGNDEVLVFLLSTKAGGLGINLTAANVVVIHDIDFNPYNDKQAEDRSHRLGQTKDVKVYKLISDGTVEEGMLEVANEKLRLGKNMSEDATKELEDDKQSVTTAKDLRSLLKSHLF